MTGRIRDNRLVFEESVMKRAFALPPGARPALIDFMVFVRRLAEGNAAESLRSNKWAMFAYWKGSSPSMPGTWRG